MDGAENRSVWTPSSAGMPVEDEEAERRAGGGDAD